MDRSNDNSPGFAKSNCYKGANYALMNPSAGTTKSKKILDLLPQNLQNSDSQSEWRNKVNTMFATNVKTYDKPPGLTGMGQSRSRSIMNNSFDASEAINVGFEMPASIQLNRLSNKLEKWEKQAENMESVMAIRDQKVKSILKKNKDMTMRVEKYQNK